MRSFGTAVNGQAFRNVRAHRLCPGREVPLEPLENALPTVICGFRPVAWPVHREERMACAVVRVKLVRLPVLGENFLEFRGFRGAWVGVVRAEEAEQRTAELRQFVGKRPDGERCTRR